MMLASGQVRLIGRRVRMFSGERSEHRQRAAMELDCLEARINFARDLRQAKERFA